PRHPRPDAARLRLAAPRGPRRGARAPGEAGTGAGAVSRTPGTGRILILDGAARGRCAAHCRDPERARRRTLRRAVPRHARSRRVPAALGLRGLLPVARTLERRPGALCPGAARIAGRRRMKTPRVFQLTALAMVVVSAVQVGWWLLDQHSQTADKVLAMRRAYAAQQTAAQGRRDAGTTSARVQQLLPDIRVSDAHAALDPQREQALLTEARHRDRQYAWEGGFFLFALGLCIAVIARALRAEARVLEEQDNFLALVSHQFKTPLASLQLSLETLALRAPAPQAARTLIDRMLADLARMELMVTQILESARLER